MQFKVFLIASVASVAIAQTTTSSAVTSTGTSTCAAQNILDSCIGTIQGQVNSCATNDYSCLCTAYSNMLTCYASCPNDPKVGTAQQQREQNCNAASVYGSTTILGTASATHSATATSTEASATSGFATGTKSGSSSSASATSKSGAESIRVGSLLAMAFAGAAAIL